MSRFWKLIIAAMLPLAMAFAACEEDDAPGVEAPGFNDDANGNDNGFFDDDPDEFGEDDEDGR